jgi:hypothetical protein
VGARNEGEPQESADDDGKNGAAFVSLHELVENLPLDPDWVRPGFTDMPASRVVLRAFVTEFRRAFERFASLERFVRELPVDDDEDGLYCGAAPSAKQATLLELAEFRELLEDLREDIYCYLRHIDAGRLVELDDDALAALREVSRSVPPYRTRPDLLVAAAVQYVARLPNRGGVVAHMEQRRLARIAAEYGHCLRDQRTGWPWTDTVGRRLTVDSKFDPKPALTETPKPRAQKT